MTRLTHAPLRRVSPLVTQREQLLLGLWAMRSADSAGRRHPEAEHPYRGPFQRDRDRVLHCSAYRRLSGKMQVFTGDMGDYHRTRLTHTQEVATIARTIARALRLNEDLVEALALVHDIGHPPYGHAGEDVLAECLADAGGFSHNAYALTIVQELEKRFTDFPGLNLTAEVLAGQQSRIDKRAPRPRVLLEVQLVDAVDSATYDAHDTDDALKLGLVTLADLQQVPLIRQCHDDVCRLYTSLDPSMLGKAIVHRLIDLQVTDLIEGAGRELLRRGFASAAEALQSDFLIQASAERREQKRELESFLYQAVYRHPRLIAVRTEAQARLRKMFAGYVAHPAWIPAKYQRRIDEAGLPRAVADYLAGMTDRYCEERYAAHFSD